MVIGGHVWSCNSTTKDLCLLRQQSFSRDIVIFESRLKLSSSHLLRYVAITETFLKYGTFFCAYGDGKPKNNYHSYLHVHPFFPNLASYWLDLDRTENTFHRSFHQQYL